MKRASAVERNLSDHHFFTFKEFNNNIPELKLLRKQLWYTTERMNFMKFKSTFGSKTYVDFRLEYNEVNESFTFYFKDVLGDIDTLFAQPYIDSKHLRDDKLRMHQDIIASYNKEVESINQKASKKNDKTEKKYSNEFELELRKQQMAQFRAWERVRSLMTEKEAEMTFDQWFAYFENLRFAYNSQILASTQDQWKAMRALQIKKLGYWNCDNPALKKNRMEPVDILAKDDVEENYMVNVLFLTFNSCLGTNSKSIIDTKGDCSYILVKGDLISWITPSEAQSYNTKGKKKLVADRNFVDIAEVDINELRARLLHPES